MEFSLEYIRRLASGNESEDVEFKETTGQLNRGMETLCGMLNGNGGVVVFGVSNKGKIIGQEIGDKTTREIGEALNKFDPAIDIQPKYIGIDDSDRYLIAFQTEGNEPTKPFMWDGKPYMRHDSVTSVMPREKFLRLYEWQHGLIYKWENEVNSRLTVADLDDRLIVNVIQGAVRRGRLANHALSDGVPEILARLKLMEDGKICNSAAVLFGKDFRDYPQCTLRLARFKGRNKQYFIDNQQIEGNVFELVDAAMAFFFKHLNLYGTTHNRLYREDELEIPYDALRESMVNAYCHMRWSYEAVTVGIAIYDDKIVIENAGKFPVRISPNELMKEEEENRKNTSMPPNPVIAKVMYLGGMIERWGRGLSMMARECERVGLPAPEFTQDGVIVKTIFTRPDSTSKDRVEVQPEYSRSTVGVQLGYYNKSIISLVKLIGEDWFTSYDLREMMDFKSKPTFRQNYLNPAIKAGLVAFENPDSPNAPNQRYGLTTKGKALYYEHRKSFEANPQNDPQNDLEGQLNPPIDPQKIPVDPQRISVDPQKANILGAIKENPSISRIELAEIAGCSESTIKRRLKEWNIAWLGHPKTGHWVEIKEI